MLTKVIPEDGIEKKIFYVREQKVMIDRHLAELYGVETRVLMQAVRRNKDSFPEDFLLELTREEIMRMSQIVISLKFSKNVYAFTEQGIAMLSSVLRSKRAVQINIAIMRTFVKLRQLLATHKELSGRLSALERWMDKKDQEIMAIFEVIRQLITPPPGPPKRPIGFVVDQR
jgi:hypothetical protein